MKTNGIKKIISLILILSIVLSSSACSKPVSEPTLSDSNSHTIVENVETENIETETVLTEHITSEIYLHELIVAEEKIEEMLLEEESIDEVLLCQTIYVPQAHIEEFAKNSQTVNLLSDKLDITSLMQKIAVGTGLIVTVAIIKKVGLPDPVASIVMAAADKSLQFAANGALIGSLFGGFTGAAQAIDETGITSAIMSFVLATAGLLLSAFGLISTIPSGGLSTISTWEGIKLVIAGIAVFTTSVTAYSSEYNMFKTLTNTDASEIDWTNIDWEKVGVSAAQKAINNGADGYMWGSIVGVIDGGMEGYENYHKYSAPYTELKERIGQTPKNEKSGKWSGERGKSDFILNEPITLENGTIVEKITYKNGLPDFSKYKIAEVKISGMTTERYGSDGNFQKANIELAKQWSETKYQGKTWTLAEVQDYVENHGLIWHEMSNMQYMQLVPEEIHSKFTHFGGVVECKRMKGQKDIYD